MWDESDERLPVPDEARLCQDKYIIPPLKCEATGQLTYVAYRRPDELSFIVSLME